MDSDNDQVYFGIVQIETNPALTLAQRLQTLKKPMPGLQPETFSDLKRYRAGCKPVPAKVSSTTD